MGSKALPRRGVARPAWRSRHVASGGASLHVREAGDPTAPTVVLVHGYPDSAAVWHDVAARLVDTHHVVTYDVRGMGGSTAPAGRAGFRLAALADDVFAVVDAVSPGGPAHLVGHDWGSIQSWEAVTDPSRNHRIATFTSVSGPCLDHVGHALRRGGRPRAAGRFARTARQGLRSSYIALLYLPLVPEALWRTVGAAGWRRFQRAAEGVVDDGRHPTLAHDGRAGVALYRQNVAQRLVRPRHRSTDVPVLLLELTGDRYVGAVLSEDLERWVPQLTRTSLAAGHWAPRTHPVAVAAAIAGHVAASGSPRGA